MKGIALLVCSWGLAGCVELVPAYDPVASHTLKTGPEQDADVVWVQQLDVAEERVVLYRCNNTPQGPTCVRVRKP